MTKEQLKHVDLHGALQLAFDAGCSYGIASHKNFVQIHEPCYRVVDAIAPRVVMPNATAHVRDRSAAEGI